MHRKTVFAGGIVGSAEVIIIARVQVRAVLAKECKFCNFICKYIISAESTVTWTEA